MAGEVAKAEDSAAGATVSALIAALKKDSQVLAEVREILAEAGPSGTVSQKVKAGRDAYNAGRDMKITR